MNNSVAVIGGGAAGFFAAITCKLYNPGTMVVLFEKADKLLAKVKISGGGRCNVTHACFSNSELIKYYPRGAKFLKQAFQQFTVSDTEKWFEERGVKLKTEEDGRMFPSTDNSQTIINALLDEARKFGVVIELQKPILAIKKVGSTFRLTSRSDEKEFTKVIVASGGSPKIEGFNWLTQLGHSVVFPVPSLFTFNMPSEAIVALHGLSVSNAIARIPGTDLMTEGPLLITHWGMSGPAILKLSAWGARILNEQDYRFKVQLNWLGIRNEDFVRNKLQEEIRLHPKREISNCNPFRLPERLFQFLLEKSDITNRKIVAELSKKELNRLVNIWLNDTYDVNGKTTFKEEFVTCGGINLSEVSAETMESKVCKGLYFAGEVLDIDGVTGGFNFQAAWTSGFIAGKNTGISAINEL